LNDVVDVPKTIQNNKTVRDYMIKNEVKERYNIENEELDEIEGI
jgi:hypothetical protein